MKPAALQITLTLMEPGEGWHYCVIRRGVVIANSDGETFPNAGPALKAAIEESQAQMRAIAGRHDEDRPGSDTEGTGQ